MLSILRTCPTVFQSDYPNVDTPTSRVGEFLPHSLASTWCLQSVESCAHVLLNKARSRNNCTHCADDKP